MKSRPKKSAQLWLLKSSGVDAAGPVADVALFVRTPHLYSYGVPPELRERVRPGAIVRVPYGKAERAAEGIVTSVSERPWDHVRKSVLAVSPQPTLLDAPLIELGLWISEYYVCPPGVTFNVMAPSQLRRGKRRVRLLRVGDAAPKEPTAAQGRMLEALRAGPLPRREALLRAGVGPAVLRGLLRSGVVAQFEAEADDAPDPTPGNAHTSGDEQQPCAEDLFDLTHAQAAALGGISGALETPQFRVVLLYGVPGSGKTEVYVRAIRRAAAAGRQSILILPEIALATQLMQRLARRFSRVALLHSQMTPSDRARQRERIAAGDVDVIIGTRSAIFAPCPRLGLIIVDEEQEGSLKSLSAPFYHARDVAIKRGQIENITLVLGSATPSLESWHNAQTLPHYELRRLEERVPGAEFPRVKLIDGTQHGDSARILSPPLARALETALGRGEQAILLHNRRGYAAFLRCRVCGMPVRCTRCGLHMVVHTPDRSIRCHRCGQHEPEPRACRDDSCGGALERSGFAVQRLEQELRALAPGARLLRLDRDTMRGREAYEAALESFARGASDVLFGTQMVAKGLDFPGVSLVGVIDADRALSIPDFRAPERVLQLIMQVVGRAGRRGGESLAVLQCVERPPHVIRLAAERAYEPFAEAELKARERNFYPPYARLARLICADEQRRKAEMAAQRVAAELRQLAGRVHGNIRVDEANECALARLRGMYRFEVLVRAPRDGSLQRLLHEAQAAKVLRRSTARLTLDVDPIDLL